MEMKSLFQKANGLSSWGILLLTVQRQLCCLGSSFVSLFLYSFLLEFDNVRKSIDKTLEALENFNLCPAGT